MLKGTVMDAYYKEVIGIIDDIHNNEKERILECARVIAAARRGAPLGEAVRRLPQ